MGAPWGKKKIERMVSVDIGSSTIKLLELEINSDGRLKITAVATVSTPANVLANHTIVNTDKVADLIRSALASKKMTATKAVIGIPGPAAFTKRASMPLSPLKDLQANIQFEASNYIPHKMDSIKLDFQVLGLNTRTTMDVMLVAVRNEVIDSYVEAVSKAGLEPKIADIDYFAIENMFEVNYSDLKDKTVAVVNMGSRYSTVNIIQNGLSLFTGDVSIGGRLYTEALCETLEIQAADAEKAKFGNIPQGVDPSLVDETLDRITEHVVNELSRQIGFFWNATATDKSIERIYLCGGGALLPGLLEEIAQKTHTTCELLDVVRNIEWQAAIPPNNLKTIAPTLGVSIGLALRRSGDKKHCLGEKRA